LLKDYATDFALQLSVKKKFFRGKGIEKKIFYFRKNRFTNIMSIARHGFEPRLQDPESRMIDHYTTGLQ
jgi:hypothetical protein